MYRFLLGLLTLSLLVACSNTQPATNTFTPNLTQSAEKWSLDQAREWYADRDWLIGANFSPSTASNQLEMWQESTWDPKTIDKELGWAEDLGMNTMRVYLHDLAYQQDPTGFLDRIDAYLEMADNHGLSTLLVFFDSCWDPFPKIGPQKDPEPHVHNSRWVQSPGYYALDDPDQLPRLEAYVRAVVGRFAEDDRILGWDVWNEPDNKTGPSYEAVEHPNKAELVLPMLQKAFTWVRSAGPTQPLTSAIWLGNWASHDSLNPVQRVQIDSSDIISFHNYDSAEEFTQRIEWLQRYDRPIMCTEYMARPLGSTFAAFLPIAQQQQVGMFNWGFVDGRTQTKYPWDSWTQTYSNEPDTWFHDILHPDGTPYRAEEVALINEYTGSK